MNGELAQAVALVAHGTVWLLDPTRLVPALDDRNSSFEYVRSTVFVDGGGGRRRVELEGVSAWLEHLRRDETSRLLLAIRSRRSGLEAHARAAFTAGGSWWIIARGGRGGDRVWEAEWAVGARDADDGRIWDVRYRSLPASQSDLPPRFGLEVAENALRDAVVGARAFAIEHDLAPWSEWFTNAVELLDSGDADLSVGDLIPDAYPEEARRLLSFAAQSWVFGGMGSWNDMAFGEPEDDEAYRVLTRELYDAVLWSVVAAVNVDIS